MRRVGEVIHQLAFPMRYGMMHDVFQVLNLVAYVNDDSHVINHEPIQLYIDLSYPQHLV